VTSGAYFTSSPDGFVPQREAHGPWSEDMLHGRLLGGLAARAIEQLAGAPDLVATRLTVDLCRVAPMAPVTVRAEVVRDGRRIRVADATMTVGGHDVARASAVLLRKGEAPPGRVWQPERWSAPHPDTLADRDLGDVEPSSWSLRTITGGFGTGERARTWTWDRASLVDDEPLSPFVRAAVSADLASPLANDSDDGLHYINADYALTMAREPVGAWIGLEAAQHVAAVGVALGICPLYDLDGPFGTSTTTALVNPPLRPPS
jgi:hypothetical protein